MGEGTKTMIFMGLVLKIPVAAMLWIVWWAVRSTPDPAEAPPEAGGENDPHRFRRSPRRPKGPRRGPHGPGHDPAPAQPGCLPDEPRRAHPPSPGPAAGEAHGHRTHV